MSEKYDTHVPPMYGEDDVTHGLPLQTQVAHPYAPVDKAAFVALLSGQPRKNPASAKREKNPAKQSAKSPTVAPMWVELNGSGGTTYTLMADDDAVRLDLIKRESLDKVKPQPAGWLVDGASGKFGELSADQVKTLTGK